jgi:predicted phage tail protein
VFFTANNCFAQFSQYVTDPFLESNLAQLYGFTKITYHPNIVENQKNIMSWQDSINMDINKLARLEQKTVDYLSKKQNDAVDIEEYSYVLKIIEDILYFKSKAQQSAGDDSELIKVVNRMDAKIAIRATKIGLRINEFAKQDGNKNLLHNEDRDDLIVNIKEMLKEMRAIASMTCREIDVAKSYKLLKR